MQEPVERNWSRGTPDKDEVAKFWAERAKLVDEYMQKTLGKDSHFVASQRLHELEGRVIGLEKNAKARAGIHLEKRGETKPEYPVIKEQGIMSGAIEQTENDFENAAWRTAATQAVSAVHKPLSTAIATRVQGDKKTAQQISALLATPEGEAALAYLLGAALPHIPQLAGDARANRLAMELRVKAATRVTDAVADAVVGPVVDALTEVVKKAPDPSE